MAIVVAEGKDFIITNRGGYPPVPPVALLELIIANPNMSSDIAAVRVLASQTFSKSGPAQPPIYIVSAIAKRNSYPDKYLDMKRYSEVGKDEPGGQFLIERGLPLEARDIQAHMLNDPQLFGKLVTSNSIPAWVAKTAHEFKEAVHKGGNLLLATPERQEDLLAKALKAIPAASRNPAFVENPR